MACSSMNKLRIVSSTLSTVIGHRPDIDNIVWLRYVSIPGRRKVAESVEMTYILKVDKGVADAVLLSTIR